MVAIAAVPTATAASTCADGAEREGGNGVPAAAAMAAVGLVDDMGAEEWPLKLIATLLLLPPTEDVREGLLIPPIMCALRLDESRPEDD